MRTSHALPAMIATAALLIGCGNDAGDTASTTTASTTTVPTTVPTTTTTSTTSPTATTMASTSTTTTVAATTTSEVVSDLQPAIWPAADVVFATPQEAAADFVANVLHVAPLLGEYVGGDARSGELEVFSPGETTPGSRSLLFLRMLGPSDGWFVIGAANPNVTISTPEANARVAAELLTVEGVGRGFESTVVVTAFLAGHSDIVFDQVMTAGGAWETPLPYTVTIDLTGASPGDVLMLLVHGDTGLDNDPGEFGALPVVIDG